MLGLAGQVHPDSLGPRQVAEPQPHFGQPAEQARTFLGAEFVETLAEFRQARFRLRAG